MSAVYSNGESEKIVGSWLAKRGADMRRRIVLSTKSRFTSPAIDHGSQNALGLCRSALLDNVEDSLGRLRLEYIDLYILHAWDEATPVAETVATMGDLLRAGKIRYWALSNVTGWQLMKFLATADALGVARPVAVQAQYSLLCRETEWDLLDCCVHEGVGLLPWSPLKGGWLSGKMSRETGAPADSRAAFSDAKGVKLQSSPGFEDVAKRDSVWTLLDALRAVGDKHGATVAQTAIRWLLQQRGVPSVVIGAKRISQLDDNLGAGAGWALDADDLKKLVDASAIPLPYPYEMVFRVNAMRKRTD